MTENHLFEVVSILSAMTIFLELCHKFRAIFIHFCFDLTEWYFQYQGIDHDTENYQSVWRQLHYYITDKNNNSSFDCLNIHNHSSSYRYSLWYQW